MSTKQAENQDVVLAFYNKLIQCGYPESATLHLLDTWHETWSQGSVSTEELGIVLSITTNLTQTTLRRLLLRYKEVYKAKQAERVLLDLYERCVAPSNEEYRKEVLFELLEGQCVSQETLDALLPVAELSTLGKVESFVRFGPTYLPEYFRHPRQERSTELLKLFTSLTEEPQDLSVDQTVKLVAPLVPVDRPVLLALLSLWLTATPFGEAGTIQLLIGRAIPDSAKAPGRKNNHPQEILAREELASILATFGSQYMASGERELRALCTQYFQWLCPDGKLKPALKLQMCMTLLPPDLFPFTTRALSLDETLPLLKIAHLAHEPTSPFVNELRRYLADHKNIAQIRAGHLATFLAQQERSVDQFAQQLQDFLAPSSWRAAELSETLEAFLRQQVRAGMSYQPSELELFLELQEYRGQALRSAIPGMPLAIYLHYVDSSEKRRAQPCRELYQRYLHNIQIENLDRRQETLELLKRLSGTPQTLDKTINVLAEGLLVFVDFLQSASRQQRQLVRRVAETDTSPLSMTMLKSLKSSLSSLKGEHYREDYYKQITDKIVFTFASCITSESDIERILDLKLGEPLYRSEERYSGFILLLEMIASARTYPHAQPERLWWLPYLLFLPKLGGEPEIQEKEIIYGLQSKVLDKLLLVPKQPDVPTARAIDIYVQQEAARNSSQEVVEIWQAYKQTSGISALLMTTQPTVALGQQATSTGEQKPITPSVLGEVNTEPVEFPVASATGGGAANSVSVHIELPIKDFRVSRFKSFQVVYNMRHAIRHANRRSIRKLWEIPKNYYTLIQHYKEVEQVYWERFQSIRQLDNAYLALLGEENSSNIQKFIKYVTECKEFEEKHKIWWKPCLEKEQMEMYQKLSPKDPTKDRGAQ